ncbi:hypothetical protein J2S43_005059 [Catenuloplanes nepalensis]|uniref:Uncharacterized protein n=1 Tax=Catenuloplanes nepalensis TaxID=587533 RepID=A0ABT9MYP7_9ACTN|nr:hypothetical protein [Catenuloplanes nepalensis]MDP9796547.1 hypothetical protein [Catenuloplanes nepalensis]
MRLHSHIARAPAAVCGVPTLVSVGVTTGTAAATTASAAVASLDLHRPAIGCLRPQT